MGTIIASLSKNEGCFGNFKFTYQKMSYESRSKHDSLTATLNAETQRVKIITSHKKIAIIYPINCEQSYRHIKSLFEIYLFY